MPSGDVGSKRQQHDSHFLSLSFDSTTGPATIIRAVIAEVGVAFLILIGRVTSSDAHQLPASGFTLLAISSSLSARAGYACASSSQLIENCQQCRIVKILGSVSSLSRSRLP